MNFSNAFQSLTFSGCSTCKGCCSDITISPTRTEILCPFNALDMIRNHKIEDDLVKQLCIIHIPKEKADSYARYMHIHPLSNIITHMTTVNENSEYEFLVSPPASIGKCPILTDKGCKYPDFKGYICAIFPFYVHKLSAVRIESSCPMGDEMDEVPIPYREAVGKLIEDFIIYSDAHKHEYQPLLRNLNEIYHFKNIKSIVDE